MTDAASERQEQVVELRELIKNKVFLLDGAMGTMLQNSGLKLGENPEIFNITEPQKVKAVHLAYLDAGADMILTNTFGANEHKLKQTGYSTREIVGTGVSLARECADSCGAFVALDIGPIGELFEPMGTLKFEDGYELFKRQIVQGVKSGADAIFIETMTDLYEMKCAVLAAKENSTLPVFATMSFESDMRTFTGCDISSMALTLEGLGVDAIGINCSLGPVEMYPMVSELLKWTTLPVIIKPNAGLPSIVDDKTTYSITQWQFADEMEKIIDLGVNIIGGCCGTTPEYISLLKSKAQDKTPALRELKATPAVCSGTKTVAIEKVRIIGERINPTGKKLFRQALTDSDIDYIVRQGIEQVEAGADILDINVGLPGINEKKMMTTVIKRLQGVLNVPLQIDSSDPEVIEAALRIYNGKAIVNSVNGEDAVLDKILPVVKKYGAAVVGLTLNKGGIPKKCEERFDIAKKILDKAIGYGIAKEDIYIDCLTLTSSAEQENAYETIKAVRMVKEQLGLKTTLGVSNISFGLPAREKLNQAFLALALANGLDLPIMNPNISEMVDTVYCYHQLTNIDKGSVEYIARFSDVQKSEHMPAAITADTNDIGYYIEKGLKDETAKCCENLLHDNDELTIVGKMLIPALDKVRRAISKAARIFLPQLIKSAEAAKAAFEIVRKSIRSKSSGEIASKGKIVLATVKGDIHDIGKNIVKVVLENYGYHIIDLGRDVEISDVVNAAKDENVKMVGLSALMTTTLKSMEQTIKALRDNNVKCTVFVGGAVLTEDYAMKIGADYYAKDAQQAVSIAKKVFYE